MDSFLQEHLEDYLDGRLNELDLAEFERRLNENPEAIAAMALFQETSGLFQAFRVDPSEDLEPAPGFYYRVKERIEAERAESFWSFLLQPVMVRSFAFAAMMWMVMLGSVAAFHDDTTSQSVELADSILKQQPPKQYDVRMGYNLKANRDSMLSVMLASAK
jgi:anti-sigma factor RsiW